MVRESFNHQVKHLLAMQYSVVELRHLALEDVLAGPDRLHDDLPSKLGQVRSLRKKFTDAQLQADPDAFPPVRRAKPRKKDHDSEIPGRMAAYTSALKGSVRQFLGTRPLSRTYPESALPAMDASWFRLSTLDSAVVSMPDGTSAALYRRDPEVFRDLLRRTIEIHERLFREWPRLSRLYRDQLDDITSPQRWEKTFDASLQERR
jgi:galactofuranosylgalactofuranosylrhamnosyl-N-acetylglucosaminyl-diphospho-decaprenol beta-1,5/1,6-galactofuranosyltransferase